ncbi:uncharacterized protein LOC122304477 [Carya illinoinensis]|uniref:uncharacterized protein LOC122304477 n=1 Tax=Carya illinoinensis TaxID=32201 RepID=UPI001C71AC03|nr:uncharacterized protein LOC122304477 [Carya illinoinensis]
MATGWFIALQPCNIYSFKELGRQFITQFMASRNRRHPTAYLLNVKQRDDESLKSYLSWFNKELLTMDEQDEKITLAAPLGSIWPKRPLTAELARSTPYNVARIHGPCRRVCQFRGHPLCVDLPEEV